MSYSYNNLLGTAVLFTLRDRRSAFVFQREWIRAFLGVYL